MKSSVKQTVITVICAILVFIPTYIAVSYYFVKSYSSPINKYEVTVFNEKNINVPVEYNDVDDIANVLIKMNSKLLPLDSEPTDLPTKFYKISVSEQGEILCSFKYYLVAQKKANSYAQDTEGNFYLIKYESAKEILSHRVSYHFYKDSIMPSLSIDGGGDILPSDAEWKFRSVNGNLLNYYNIRLADEGETYAMRSSSRLSFSIEPTDYSVKVYSAGKYLNKYTSLDDIPYDMLDSNDLTFKIEAKWKSSECQGSAYYEFSTYTATAPEYTILNPTVKSGEFFVIMAENVSAPQKIVFSSSPAIEVSPVFYKEGDKSYALIPIKKELDAPCEYTFTLKYGYHSQSFSVNVESRSIYEKEYSVTLPRNQKNLNAYNALLNSIGPSGEAVRYFGGKFLDYSPSSASDGKLADVFFGFGHRIIPNNGDDPYRLDGVVYMFPDQSEVPAICAGKVTHTGSDELLGTYVVVDHGFGLKTWYCNLSSTTITVGTTVAKGQTIGISGDTGYQNIHGVYLITTVYSIPISPYPLQEEGLSVFH